MPAGQYGACQLVRADDELADVFDQIDSAALTGLGTRARTEQWQARHTLLAYVDSVREARAGGDRCPGARRRRACRPGRGRRR